MSWAKILLPVSAILAGLILLWAHSTEAESPGAPPIALPYGRFQLVPEHEAAGARTVAFAKLAIAGEVADVRPAAGRPAVCLVCRPLLAEPPRPTPLRDLPSTSGARAGGRVAGAPAVTTPWTWLPPRPWTCARCSAVVYTADAGPRCPACGFREET